MRQDSSSPPLILVADDCEDIRDLVCVQLRLLGYRVIAASDGREAVELARRERPALILLDMSMPVLDGFSAARLIRSIEDICRIFIVAFSAHGSSNRQRAIEAGCDEYLNKPVGVNQLQTIVRRFLQAA